MVKRQSHKLITIVCSLLLLPFVAHSGSLYTDTDIVPILLHNANILLLDANQEFIQEYILLHNAYEPQNGNQERRENYKSLKRKIFLKYHPDKHRKPDQKKQAETLSGLLNNLIQEIENPKDDIILTFPDTLIPQIYGGFISPLYNFHLYAGAITGAVCAHRTLSAFNQAFNFRDNNQAVTASLKTSLSNLDNVFTQMTQNQKNRYLQQKQHLVSILK